MDDLKIVRAIQRLEHAVVGVSNTIFAVGVVVTLLGITVIVIVTLH